MKISQSQDARALFFLIAWHFVYFFPVTLGQSVWFTTDIVRLYYPFALESQRQVLPLWTDKILAGFPLFAEGQAAALYPPNIILYALLPAVSAISFGILLHLAFAACGMYVFVRVLGLSGASAVLAGLVFSFNGWIFGHLSHPSVIAAIAWLPWSLFFVTRWQQTRVGIWFFLTCIAIAAMYLSGSVQLAFLSSLAYLVIGAANAFFERRASHVLLTVAAFALGVGIAAVQLVPTAELVGYSVRSGTDSSFYTTYSLPFEFLQQFIAPFFQGEPSEGTGEYWTYVAIAPLFLMILAPLLKRDRRALFYFTFALVALSLALGGNNPLFSILYRLPIFGLFRVPARYLFLFTFAAALCVAFSFEALSQRLDARARFPRWLALLAPPLIGVIYLAHFQRLEFWLEQWAWLPYALAILAGLAIVLAIKRNMSRENFVGLILAATILDLGLYMLPFLKTIDELSPISVVATEPRSLSILRNADGRVFVDQSVFPSAPAIRGSIYPNTALIYGVPTAQAYTSLSFGRHEAYVSQASPAMLNLLNARWFTIPLEPRPSGNRLTPPDNFYLALGDDPISISPTIVTAVEISSFTEQAEKLSDGTPVSEIEIAFRDGSRPSFSLRVGIETADWDYDRKVNVAHKRAQVAHSFPAFWRSFGKPFEGHTYRARFDLPAREVAALRLRMLDPNVQFTIERITLLDAAARPTMLSTLSNRNDFVLAYLSDTVAIWENKDALPQAFMVHGAEITDDSAAFARMKDAAFEPRSMVLLSEGRGLPRVDRANDKLSIERPGSSTTSLAIDVETDAPGYLVLADSWYPGWSALLDDKPVPIYRADVIFRAVEVGPGHHTVQFRYEPMSLWIGVAITAASVILALASTLRLERKRHSRV